MKFMCLPCVVCVYLTISGKVVCEIGRKVVIVVVVHKKCRLELVDIVNFQCVEVVEDR